MYLLIILPLHQRLKTPYGQLDLSIQKDSVSKIHTVEISMNSIRHQVQLF